MNLQLQLPTPQKALLKDQISLRLLPAWLFANACLVLLATLFNLAPKNWLPYFLLNLLLLAALEVVARWPWICLPIIGGVLLVTGLATWLSESLQKWWLHWLGFVQWQVIPDVLQAWAGGQPLSDPTAALLRTLLALGLVLFSFILVRLLSLPWLMILIAAGLAGLLQHMNLRLLRSDLALAVALLAAFLVLARYREYRRPPGAAPVREAPRGRAPRRVVKRQFLPLARISLLVALALLLNQALPAHALYSKTLDNWLRDIENRFFSGPETIGYFEFSLNSAGYFPQSSRLGGPVQLSPSVYANVLAGPETQYLRGAVYGEYSGWSWKQEEMTQNFLFADKGAEQEQYDAFAIELPAESRESVELPLLSATSYQVVPVYQPQQAILVSGVPHAIASLDEQAAISAYFNRAGSIYADRTLPDPGYRVEGLRLNNTHPDYYRWLRDYLQNSLAISSRGGSTRTLSPERRAHWLQLPATVDDGLLDRFLQEASDHYQLHLNVQHTRVSPLLPLILREMLSNDLFRYRLDVPEVPHNTDFTAWFLQQREGYCTYFATALAVLCRQAGIPARYVEGYVLPAVPGEAGEQYARNITGLQAHAWTEVWFEGLGWLPLDATPAGHVDELTNRAAAETQPTPQPTPEAEAEETPAPTEAEAAPDPETEPTLADGGEDQDTVAPVPGAVAGLTGPLLVILVLALLILALSAYLIWRKRVWIRRHHSGWLFHRYRGRERQMLRDIWADVQALCRLSKLELPDSWTVQQKIQRLNAHFSLPGNLVLIDRTLYSDAVPDDPEIRQLLADYAELEKACRAAIPPLRWLFRRYLWSFRHPL